jgi:ATP-dependent Lon protease
MPSTMANHSNKTKTKITTEEDAPTIVTCGEQTPADGKIMQLPRELYVLPVRNTVTFPGTVVPLSVQREKSRRMLAEFLPEEKVILVLGQRNPDKDDPGPDDLYEVGTAMAVLKLLRMEDESQNLIVHGLERVRVVDYLQTDPFLRARIEPLQDQDRSDKTTQALVMNVREAARRVIELSPNIPEEAQVMLNNIPTPGGLADFLASNLQLEQDKKQLLLETTSVKDRLEQINSELHKQVDLLELSSKLQSEVKENIDKSQRQYFLQEQLKAIQKELGVSDEKTEDIEEIRAKLDEAELTESAAKEANRELSRLEKLPTASPEYSVIRTYLEVLSEVPWSKATEDHLDVQRAEKVLDEDHYDLEKVKRRILEYLAVRKLAQESRGPILCFVGPPGVGKTSLGQSIARSLGRKFIRMSLGGVRDEAELRGHRRTYIGSLPGRIVQEVRKVGVNNPVFMLDEVDKLGQDFRGDPTSALLEILDPAQNSTFQDHYLNVPFDLSKTIFIATANYIGNVPPPLRDRMEVIEIPGYTPKEKLQIARQYLLKRQRKENGLKASQCRWNNAALRIIIDEYTREAGVRELERQIGAVMRGVAAMIARGDAEWRKVTEELIRELLGPRKYESELAQRTSVPGVVTGLAYTPTGGQILFIEAAGYPGKSGLQLTGQIGDVMKESAQAALSLVRSQTETINPDFDFAKNDIHIHVPAGAVPKDGPSAGVAMFTALVSLLSRRPVRADVAMTGEITLRGLVMPIGGVKEKVLAAKRAGIKRVILPKRNEKDLVDVPPEAKTGLKFFFADTVDDVIRHALQKKRVPKTTVTA